MTSVEQFLKSLARGKPVPAVVLCGTDAYLRDMCRKKIIDTFVPEGVREWGVSRMSARTSGWDEIFQRAQTVPMLARHQVIDVDEVEYIEELGDESRDAIIEMMSSYLASPAPFTVLVLEAASLDGRQKFTRVLNEKALVVDLSIGGASAASLAMQMAKDAATQLEPNAAALLADMLNGEPARMHIEIEKLATYTQDRGRITGEDVENLVVVARKNTVWQFADMIAGGKRDTALEFLNNLLRDGEQPAGIVGALAWMYRKLIEARELPPNSRGFQASRALGMRQDAAETAVRQAHRMSKKDLLAGLAALAEADSALKSSNPDPRAFMEFLIARLTPPAPAPMPARR